VKRSWGTQLLLFILFVLFFGVAVSIQNQGVAKIKGNPPFYETWQLQGDRSSEIIKVLSLRYDLLMADFLWLRAIQSFGGRGMTNRDWRPIYNMFDTITDLDPYFESAYTFGNLVIGDEGGYQREGLKLLEKDVRGPLGAEGHEPGPLVWTDRRQSRRLARLGSPDDRVH
jgi:hypothetical protein